MRIGLDFDNTIAGYDESFLQAARTANLVDIGFTGGKEAVRHHLRTRPDGERLWQALQGRVYGFHMQAARLIDGVAEFLAAAKGSRADLFIISHKTQFGHYDLDRIDLRQQALQWMRGYGFFEQQLGLSERSVYFELTREAKIGRIEEIAPDYFIDDLPEVFDAVDFPPTVKQILFDQTGRRTSVRYACSGDWRSISRYLFGPQS